MDADPGDPRPRSLLHLVEAVAGRASFTEAEAHIRAIADDHPGIPSLRARAALTAYKGGDQERARNELRELVEEHSDYPSLHEAYASVEVREDPEISWLHYAAALASGRLCGPRCRIAAYQLALKRRDPAARSLASSRMSRADRLSAIPCRVPYQVFMGLLAVPLLLVGVLGYYHRTTGAVIAIGGFSALLVALMVASLYVWWDTKLLVSFLVILVAGWGLFAALWNHAAILNRLPALVIVVALALVFPWRKTLQLLRVRPTEPRRSSG